MCRITSNRARVGPSESRVKARCLAACVARVQALFAGLLARSSSGPRELAARIAALSKRLMVHLDLLLAVCSSAESSPHRAFPHPPARFATMRP